MKKTYIILGILILVLASLAGYFYFNDDERYLDMNIETHKLSGKLLNAETQSSPNAYTIDLTSGNHIYSENKDGVIIVSDDSGDIATITLSLDSAGKTLSFNDKDLTKPSIDFKNYNIYNGEFTHNFQIPVDLTAKPDLNFKAKYTTTCNTNSTTVDNKFQCGKILIDFNTLKNEVSTANLECSGLGMAQTCTVKNYLTKPQAYDVITTKDGIEATLNSKYQIELDSKKKINSSDMIVLDPTYTITNLTLNSGVQNVKCEAGGLFCHSAINDSSLVFYMPFDVNMTGSSLIEPDWTANNLVGTRYGNAHWNNSGIYGGDMDFDGTTDFIDFGNVRTTPLNLSGTKPRTISVWLKTADINSAWLVAISGEYNTGSNPIYRIQQDNTDNPNKKWTFTMYDSYDSGFRTLKSTTSIVANTWYHVTGTYDGANMVIYINGKAEGSPLAITAPYSDDTTNLLVRIGNYYGGAAWNGAIDEVMIFNRSLSAGEISQIYNKTFYRFKDGGNQTMNSPISTIWSFVNISTQNLNQKNSTADLTNLSLRLTDDGGATWTAPQNVSKLLNYTYGVHNTATNINLTFNYFPDLNNFFSPVLYNPIIINDFTGWAYNKTINSSLVNGGLSSYPDVFNLNGNTYLISGFNDGSYDGYVWNGTLWASNTTITTGLVSSEINSRPTIFNLNGNTYLISTSSAMAGDGFVWNGTRWNSNATILLGLSGYQYSSFDGFGFNNYNYLIQGTNDGTFAGFVFNGTRWNSNTTIIAGLTNVGMKAQPHIFSLNGSLYLISGNLSGGFTGFIWNGTLWVNHSGIINGLRAFGSNMQTTLAVFNLSNYWYGLSGDSEGGFKGFVIPYPEIMVTVADIIPPIITVNSPTANQIITTSSVNFTLTLNEAGSSCWASLNNFLTNYSMQGTTTIWNYTNGTIANGNYLANFSCNDTSGNRNSTAWVNFTINLAQPDTEYPLFNVYVSNPANSSNYSLNAIYRFNSSITSTNGTIVLEFNNANYTSSNFSSVFNSSVFNLPVGTYPYRWFGWGNGTSHNYNTTIIFYYTVNPASSQTSLTFDKTSPQNYSTAITPTCSFISGTGTLSLTNGTSGNPETLGAGTWNLNCSYTGNNNFTASSNFTTFVINKNSTLALGLTATTPITYGATTNFVAGESGCPAQLSAQSLCLLNISDAIYGTGTINANYSTAGNNNYTQSSAVFSVAIAQAGNPVPLLINGIYANFTGNYPYQTNSSVASNITALKLERDGVDVTATELNKNITLGGGAYIMNASVIGNNNYTANFSILNITILQGSNSIQLKVNGQHANFTATYPYQTNASTNANSTVLILSRDGIDATAGEWNKNITLGVGSYILNATLLSNQNYTTNSSFLNILILQGAGNVTQMINQTRGNFTSYNNTDMGYQAWINGTLITGNGNIEMWVNGSIINNGSSPLANYTNLTSGFYNITTIYRGNNNFSSYSETWWVNITMTIAPPDVIPPAWSNNITSPISPVTYALNQVYQFNITAVDNNAISKVILTFNGTNYTASNSGSVYNVTLLNLGASVYQYGWSMNDTSGNTNRTNLDMNYTINKAIGNITFYINNTRANFTSLNNTNLGYQTWLNATLITGTGDIELWVNGSKINSGASQLSNYTNLTFGFYNATAVYSGNNNYSGFSETWWVNVTKTITPADTTPCDIFITAPVLWQNFTSTVVGLNVSTTCTDASDWLYTLDNFATNISFIPNTTITGSQGWNYLNVSVNDTANNRNSTGLRFFIDSINPSIDYGAGTEINWFNSTDNRTWIFVNVSVIETNFKSITFSLKNDSGTINTTIYTTQIYFINFTDLGYGNYSYNVSVFDILNNFNTTENRWINLSRTALPICTETLANTTKGDWHDYDCNTNQKRQIRNWTQYDTNNCGYVNVTFYEYQLIGNNWQNTTWSGWSNNGLCQITDLQGQNRSSTQYDTFACGTNTTNWEFQDIACNYCSYELTNTTWNDWVNISCINYQNNQSRNLTQYDSNRASCYDVTGLPSDLYNNETITDWRLYGTCGLDTTPPTFTNCRNLSGYTNSSFNQSITATDSSGIGTYWLNDTLNFIVNGAGLITNNTYISVPALYNLNLTVNDTKGNEASCLFYINITDRIIIPSGTATMCRYKKFGYYNLKLPWLRQESCM